MSKTVKKIRAIAGILYTDSAPADWQDRIADLHMMALVSPLHDSDVQADGSPKKPHYHIMLIFDGPVAVDRAAKLLQDIGCIDYTQSIHSVTSYARYLCHLDDHDKHPYNTQDVKAYGGADYELMCQRSLIRYCNRRVEDYIDTSCVRLQTIRTVLQSKSTNMAPPPYNGLRLVRQGYIKSAYWDDLTPEGRAVAKLADQDKLD